MTHRPAEARSQWPELPLLPAAVRPTLVGRASAIWARKELLQNLIRKELRLRYQSSILGFAWSFATPLMYLVVFSLVFRLVMRVALPRFGLFLVTGLILWNLFAAAVSAATVSISGSPNLVTRLWFPREILPLASIGAQLIHLALQLLVLVAALAIFRNPPEWALVALLPLAILTLVIFAAALGIVTSALNTFFRDVEYVVELALVAGFWATPIVYPANLVLDRLPWASWFLALNPAAAAITTFQGALYNHPEVFGSSAATPGLPLPGTFAWHATLLLVGFVVACCLLVAAVRIFSGLDDRLAEVV